MYKRQELGGYIENSSISGNSYYHQSTRYASYTIRIPSEQLDQFVDIVSELGNVTPVSYTHLDVYKRQKQNILTSCRSPISTMP